MSNSKELNYISQKNSRANFLENKNRSAVFGHPQTTASIMSMLEQMVERRSQKAAIGLIDKWWCRVCYKQNQTVEHLVTGGPEYLVRHNRALMKLAVTWTKGNELFRNDMV